MDFDDVLLDKIPEKKESTKSIHRRTNSLKPPNYWEQQRPKELNKLKRKLSRKRSKNYSQQIINLQTANEVLLII